MRVVRDRFKDFFEDGFAEAPALLVRDRWWVAADGQCGGCGGDACSGMVSPLGLSAPDPLFLRADCHGAVRDGEGFGTAPDGPDGNGVDKDNKGFANIDTTVPLAVWAAGKDTGDGDYGPNTAAHDVSGSGDLASSATSSAHGQSAGANGTAIFRGGTRCLTSCSTASSAPGDGDVCFAAGQQASAFGTFGFEGAPASVSAVLVDGVGPLASSSTASSMHGDVRGPFMDSASHGNGQGPGAAGLHASAFGTFSFDFSHGVSPRIPMLRGGGGDGRNKLFDPLTSSSATLRLPKDACVLCAAGTTEVRDRAGPLASIPRLSSSHGNGLGGTGLQVSAPGNVCFEHAHGMSTRIPLLRGGGGGGRSRLLDALTQVLSECEDQQQDEDEAWLYAEIDRLVRRRPRNLLQELKHIVKSATRAPCRGGQTAWNETWTTYDSDEWSGWSEDQWWGAPTTEWHQDASGWWAGPHERNAHPLRDHGSAVASERTLSSQGHRAVYVGASATPAPTLRAHARDQAVQHKTPESEWTFVQRKKRRDKVQNRDGEQAGPVRTTSSWNYQREAWSPPAGFAIAHVASPSELARQLDEVSGVAWVYAAPTAEDAREALDLVQAAVADDDRQSLQVILQGKEEPGDFAGTPCTVPGTVDGALRMRRCYLYAVGAERTLASLQTKAASTVVVRKPPPTTAARRAASWVVRCELDGRFHPESWAKIKAQPASHARQWARACGVNAADLLDTFGAREIGPNRVAVFLRVADAKAATLLCKSSGRIQGHYWCADVVGSRESLKLPGKVMWQRWLPTETWAEYWKRVAKQAEEGIAIGTHQLGIKMDENDPRYAQAPCVWRVAGVRSNWALADVQDLLKELGFNEPVVEQKIRGRRGPEWLFRATHSDNSEVLQRDVDWTGEGDISEIVIVKEARRRKPEAFTRLRQERIVDFIVPSRGNRARGKEMKNNSKPPGSDTPVAETGVAVSPTLPSPDSPKPEPAAAAERKRARDGDIAEEPHMEVEPTEWWPEATLQANVGEGNCLWHALTQHANMRAKQQGKPERSHRQIRQYTVHVMKQRQDLSEVWVGQGRHDAMGKECPDLTWQEYLKAQAVHGTWSGALELAAYCVDQNLRCWVTTDRGALHLLNGDVDKKADWLALRYRTDGHWELWTDADETQFWTRAVDLAVESRPKELASLEPLKLKFFFVKPALLSCRESDTLRSLKELRACKQDIPYIQSGWVPDGEEGAPPKSVRPGARLVGLLAGLKTLRAIRGWETRDGDSSHQLVRIARKADKRHSSWGCKKCAAIWPKWQDVQSAVGDKLDSVCHGVDDRVNRLRSQSAKQWWSARPEVSRASAKKHLKLTKREVCLLSSTYHQVAKEFGPPTRIVRVYNRATRIRK
ncbi:Pol, partial [Symbiodinium sp. KB8]